MKNSGVEFTSSTKFHVCLTVYIVSFCLINNIPYEFVLQWFSYVNVLGVIGNNERDLYRDFRRNSDVMYGHIVNSWNIERGAFTNLFGAVIEGVVEVSYYPYHLRDNCCEWLALWRMFEYSKIERSEV